LDVCAHDILAARITSVSYMSISYYASGPGASSESATTSVNNKSYRLDDVTVDTSDLKSNLSHIYLIIVKCNLNIGQIWAIIS
jgi:hypothetical protein